MADETKLNKVYAVHTVGGQTLFITAFDIDINQSKNRIYFLDADGNSIDKWIVFLSGVAVIDIRAPQPVGVAPLRM